LRTFAGGAGSAFTIHAPARRGTIAASSSSVVGSRRAGPRFGPPVPGLQADVVNVKSTSCGSTIPPVE
jgi:hypothetical protein